MNHQNSKNFANFERSSKVVQRVRENLDSFQAMHETSEENVAVAAGINVSGGISVGAGIYVSGGAKPV